MKRKRKDDLVQIDPSLSDLLEKAREEGERLERLRIVLWLRYMGNYGDLAHHIWVGAHMGGTEAKPYRTP